MGNENTGAPTVKPTNIPISEKPSSLEDALKDAKPIGGAKPLDVVTVYCTGGKKANVLKYVLADGTEVTIIKCT